MKLNFTITDEYGWQKVTSCEANDKRFEASMLSMINALAGLPENCHVENITMNCKITREQEEN